jgi:FlaA1/EpsC-like NDP-sugar epimerase
MGLFTGKTLMITGGTGSFGNAVLNRFLKTDVGEIRIFSRDEKKQDDMRHHFQVTMPEVVEKIKFYIGDVRSIESVRSAMPGVDYIFHAAALKQVPSCEFFPMEAVCEMFGGKKEDIRKIGIRHGEKMYETLLTNEECAKAIDMGNFYRVPADNRDLNYDKYFKEGDEKRNTFTEFNSNNTRLLNIEETKAKIASLKYIQERLNEDK